MKAGRRVLGTGEGTDHLWAQIKRQRCGKLHLYPLPQRRSSCSPQKFQRAPTQACTQNISFWLNCSQDSEGQVGKKPQIFLFQNRILACPLVKFLFSAHFCCCWFFLKEKNQREGRCNLPHLNQSAASQNLLGRGPSRMHRATSISSPGI